MKKVKKTKAPVLSDKYSVDVLWKDLEETDEDGNVTIDHPYGWKSKAIDLDDEGSTRILWSVLPR